MNQKTILYETSFENKQWYETIGGRKRTFEEWYYW